MISLRYIQFEHCFLFAAVPRHCGKCEPNLLGSQLLAVETLLRLQRLGQFGAALPELVRHLPAVVPAGGQLLLLLQQLLVLLLPEATARTLFRCMFPHFTGKNLTNNK